MEDTDGGLHPAVDGQSLDEDEDEDIGYCILECWGFCFEIWAFSTSSIWVANCLSCWGPYKHAIASISNSIYHWAVSVYTCVQSACGYFSSSIYRVRAICCVGICCLVGSRLGTSRKMVALRSSWFQSLLQRRFSSLICGSRISSCVLLAKEVIKAKWTVPKEKSQTWKKNLQQQVALTREEGERGREGRGPVLQLIQTTMQFQEMNKQVPLWKGVLDENNMTTVLVSVKRPSS